MAAPSHNGRVAGEPGYWLGDAVKETVGTGSSLAWELLESDLLQLLTQEVRKTHPEVQLSDAVLSAGDTLKEARETAIALIARHEAQADLRRINLVRTAIASMQVWQLAATVRLATHWGRAPAQPGH